jgi:hypothetical protein
MMLLMVISTVLIGIGAQSSALVSQGANLISLHQKSRSAIERMAPILATSVTSPGKKSILIPKLKSSDPVNPPYDFRIRFHTTEDFLQPGYDPRAPYDPTTLAVYTYEFAFIPDDPMNPNSLGKIELHKMKEGTDDVDTALEPRVIAHGVQQFRCLLINANTLEVTVDTAGQRKGPQGNMIDVVEPERAVLSIPSESYF